MWTHTLKKLYYCAPACMSSVQSRGISNCSELWSGKSADAADMTGIPCFVKMRWRVEMGKRNSSTTGRKIPAADHRGFGRSS
jgi:hypothetical protein